MSLPSDYKSEVVALLGQPVVENPTGVMQEAAFRAADLNWKYVTFEVSPQGLTDAIRGARAMCFRGLNLTIPHKVTVLKLLDEIAPDALAIGAVNTVRRQGDRLIGENTDGKGFLRGMRLTAGVDPLGKRAVVLGAGGAARAIAAELALAGAAEVLIVNRSIARGEQTTDDLRHSLDASLHFEPWRGTFVPPADTDILVNATSIGLHPNIDAMPEVDLSRAKPGLMVCDVVFNPTDTRFLRTAKHRGLRVLDGLSMLVHQGAIAFELWAGRPSPETVMRQALRQALKV